MLQKVVFGSGRVVALFFLAIVGIMTWEVVARYGFNAPTFWAHEITGVLAAIAFIFGGIYCAAEGSHMRIGFLADSGGRLIGRLSFAATVVCGVVYLGGLAVGMWRISQRSLFKFTPDGDWAPKTSGTSWNTMAPSIIDFALFIGAVVFLVVVLASIVDRGLRPATSQVAPIEPTIAPPIEQKTDR